MLILNSKLKLVMQKVIPLIVFMSLLFWTADLAGQNKKKTKI